jgi:hypothetical protein
MFSKRVLFSTSLSTSNSFSLRIKRLWDISDWRQLSYAGLPVKFEGNINAR